MNLMADASVSIESVLKKKNPDTILRGLVKGAKEIENATTIMAEKARLLASTLDDNSLNKIQTAAKHAILKAQSMVVAAKVMAPYLHRPEATAQFSSSICALSKDIRALSSMCHVSYICTLFIVMNLFVCFKLHLMWRNSLFFFFLDFSL